MKNKETILPKTEQAVDEIKVNKVNFTQDILVFLNYMNRIVAGDYELTIIGNFLYIKDTKKRAITCIVPLTNVGSAEIE